MTLLLSKQGNNPSEKAINLNFKGWRAFGLSLDSDFEQPVTKELDTVQFVAPTHDSGELFIDRVMFSIDDGRYQWSDYHVKNRMAGHFPEIDFGLPTSLPEATEQQKQALNAVKQKPSHYWQTATSDFLLCELNLMTSKYEKWKE